VQTINNQSQRPALHGSHGIQIVYLPGQLRTATSSPPMRIHKLHVHIGTPISTAAFHALCGLGGGRAGVSGTRLTAEPHWRAYTVTYLGSCIIGFPALQLFPHQLLHLFPVDFTVTTQSVILRMEKESRRCWQRDTHCLA
jgi:hypothetical protein